MTGNPHRAAMWPSPTTRWFQSRLSGPDAKTRVLQGDDFTNKAVATFSTPELAERAVRAVNAHDDLVKALTGTEQIVRDLLLLAASLAARLDHAKADDPAPAVAAKHYELVETSTRTLATVRAALAKAVAT